MVSANEKFIMPLADRGVSVVCLGVTLQSLQDEVITFQPYLLRNSYL
jgi:hypothetical protein